MSRVSWWVTVLGIGLFSTSLTHCGGPSFTADDDTGVDAQAPDAMSGQDADIGDGQAADEAAESDAPVDAGPGDVVTPDAPVDAGSGDVVTPDAAVDAGPAVLTLTPSSYKFGTTRVGDDSAQAEFTVTNTGGSDAKSVVLGISGTDKSAFRLLDADNCMPIVGAGATCKVHAVFRPDASKLFAAQLDVTYDGGSALAAQLSGTGGEPVLKLTPDNASWEYPDGLPNGSVAPKTFTVTNNGSYSSGNLTTALAGNNTSMFAIVEDDCNNNSLPAGQSCTLKVQPISTQAGVYDAQLGIVDGATSYMAQLTATVNTQPDIQFSPMPVTMPEAWVGEEETTTTVTVNNNGQMDAENFQVSLATGDPIRIKSSTCTSTLKAKGFCSLELAFAPGKNIAYQDQLQSDWTFWTNAAGSTVANVNGTGLLATWSPAEDSHYFQTVYVGAMRQTSLKVTNTGNGTDTPQFWLSNPTNFNIDPNQTTCGGPLPGGQSCDISLTFNPKSEGLLSSYLRIKGDHAGLVSVLLTGNGKLGPKLEIYPSSSVPEDFGVINPGESSVLRMFTVKNVGKEDATSLHVGNLQGMTGIYPNSCEGRTLKPGQICTFYASMDSTVSDAGKTLHDTIEASETSVNSKADVAIKVAVRAAVCERFVDCDKTIGQSDGTKDKPYRSIRDALVGLPPNNSAGCVIFVKAGTTCNEAPPLNNTNKVLLHVPDDVRIDMYGSGNRPVVKPIWSSQSNPDGGVIFQLRKRSSLVNLHLVVPEPTLIAGYPYSSNTVNFNDVVMVGSDSMLDSDMLVCATTSHYCHAIETKGSVAHLIRSSYVDLEQDKALGLVQTDGSTTANLLDSQFDANSSTRSSLFGVLINAGNLTTQGVSFTNLGIGLYMNTGAQSLRMRDTNVLDYGGSGVDIYPSGDYVVDLGTPDDPGGNTFKTSYSSTTRVGVWLQSSAGKVSASGNTWIPNIQDADSAGHYTVGKTASKDDSDSSLQPANFEIDGDSGLLEF